MRLAISIICMIFVGFSAYAETPKGFGGKSKESPRTVADSGKVKKCTLSACQRNYCDRMHPGSTTCAAKCVALGNC